MMSRKKLRGTGIYHAISTIASYYYYYLVRRKPGCEWRAMLPRRDTEPNGNNGKTQINLAALVVGDQSRWSVYRGDGAIG